MKKTSLFNLFVTFVLCLFYSFVSAQPKYDNLVKVVQVIKADCNSNKGSIVIERMASCEITLWFSNDNTVKTIFQKQFNSWQLRDTIKDLELGSYGLSSKSDVYTDYDIFKMESYLNLKIQTSNKNIICGNSGTILVAPLAQKYLWSTGETTQMITVKNPGKVKLTITEPSEKVCSLTDSIDLKLNPQINIDVLLSKSSCNADSTLVQYKLSGGKKPYKMTYSPNRVCFEGCAMPTDTTKYLKYWSSGYTLYLTDSLGCYAKKEFYLQPNSSELKLAYNKTTSLCEGDSVVFNDKFPNDDKHTHQWYRNGSLLSEASTSDFYTKLEGSYHVIIKSKDCVIYSDTNNVDLIKRTPLECSVSENSNCLGVPITYEAPAKKSNYDWRFNDLKYNVDYLILDGGSYFSNKLVVKWLSPGEKKIYLNYSEQCPDRSELLLKSNVKSPINLITLNPSSNLICQGVESTFRVKDANSSLGSPQPLNLTWDVPGATKGVDYEIKSTLENEITIKWIKPAKYKLIVFNADSITLCGGTNKVVFEITVNAVDQPTLIADKGSVCFGNVIEYKTELGKQNYVWNIPNKIKGTDYILIDGGDSQSNKMKVNWLTQGLNQVTINYLSSNGLCTAGKPAEIYTQVQMPIELVHTTPEKSDVCLNSIVTYKVKNLNAPYSIMNQQNLIWTVYGDPSRDYKVLAGGNATDSSITIQWLKPSKTGVFVNTNNCGNSLSFDVTVHDTINIKKIVATLPFNLCKIDSLKLSVSNLNENTIQWYLNDKEITKAIDSIFYAKLPGKYNVVIKNTGNCSFTSDYFEFKKDTCNSVAKLNDLQDDKITVYPNPASTLLNIDLNNPNVKSVALVNVLGQKVIHQDLQTMNNVINVQDVTKGMYLVSFFNEHNEIISTKKITIK